nr:hypothetical protein [Tanacetum cinerariifolium]
MWIDNPVVVKKEFLEHFSTRFQQPRRIRPVINIDFPCTISDNSYQEIERAVWDCGLINLRDQMELLLTSEPTPYSYNDSPNFINPPPQPQTYSCELCRNDHHYGSNCLPRFSLQDLNLKLISDELMIEQRNELFKAMPSMFEEYRQREQATNLSTHIPEPSRRFNSIYYDDDDDYDYEKSTIPLNETISQIPLSIVITTSPPALPIKDPEVSLIMGNEELNTIPEKESDEFIKSSTKDLVPIPSEFEDTSRGDSECILPCDDESLSDEDVAEDNVKIYSNPLFEFNDEYISIDGNPLFDEVLEDIECKDFYDSYLDESTFQVTPLFDVNEDEYFTPGDDVELLLHHDPSTPMMSVVSILEGFTNEPPLKENDNLFDLESKENKWKKILYDAPIDDLLTEDKIFDPGIQDQNFSPTYWNLLFLSPPGVRILFLTPASSLFIFLIGVELSYASMDSKMEEKIPAIEKNATESLEAAVLAKSSSQPQSSYLTAALLSEFELTEILMDKMEENNSYFNVEYKMEIYDALVKSYETDKDLFDTYGKAFSLKRNRDEDKDQDPSAGSDRWTERKKSSKDAESSKEPNLKESKSSGISKDASRTQQKSSDKPAHAEEPSHTVDDSRTKAASYEIKWIEDMVPNLWSPEKRGSAAIQIYRRGKDLQLGVESYQKKLNLMKPDKFRPDLRQRTAFTAYSDPKGVIYKDQFNRNRLMRTDELHKFSDGTLSDVRSILHDISSGLRMDYLLKRICSRLDKQRARVMIQDIVKQLRDRRLMRSLEKFIGGREYGEDPRLLQKTI